MHGYLHLDPVNKFSPTPDTRRKTTSLQLCYLTIFVSKPLSVEEKFEFLKNARSPNKNYDFEANIVYGSQSFEFDSLEAYP